MKKIDRGKLRGKPLDEDCSMATRTSHELGPNDNRIFCYGLVNCVNDEIISKCRECNAYWRNEENTRYMLEK